MRKLILLSSFLSAALIACGSSSNNNTSPDANHGGSGSGGTPDGGGGSGGSGSGGSGGSACPIADSFSPSWVAGSNADDPSATEVAFYRPDAGNDVVFEGVLANAGDAVNEEDLVIFFEPGGSDFGTPLKPKSGIDLASAQDAQVQITTDYGSDGTPGITYIAGAGTLNVTAIGSAGATLTGSLSSVVLAHVDIGSNNQATQDPDGCESDISSASFSTPIFSDSAGFQGTSGLQRTFVLHRAQ